MQRPQPQPQPLPTSSTPTIKYLTPVAEQREASLGTIIAIPPPAPKEKDTESVKSHVARIRAMCDDHLKKQRGGRRSSDEDVKRDLVAILKDAWDELDDASQDRKYESILELAGEFGVTDEIIRIIAPLGSGVNERPLERPFCSNFNVAADSACSKTAKMVCSACHLVSYCSKECQRENWKLHRSMCKSTTIGDDWKPSWEREFRKPHFISKDRYVSFGGSDREITHLWGNCPAMDVLRMTDSDKALNSLDLLFAASGDPRDIIMTVNGVPEDYQGSLRFRVNDRAPLIVVRNLAILGLLAGGEDQIDTAIALWYSTCITCPQKLRIMRILKDWLEVLIPIADGTAKIVTWDVGGIAFTLSGKNADLVVHFLILMLDRWVAPDIPFGTLLQTLTNDYRAIMRSHERRDYVDRYMLRCLDSRHERIGWLEAREYGVFLPVGAMNAHHNVGNVFLFHPVYGFTMTAASEKLEGWDIDAMRESGRVIGVPKNDLTGCMFHHVRAQLRVFVNKIKKHGVAFHLSCEDAAALTLPKDASFDRIWVSNISDLNYLGIDTVLRKFSPLLNVKRNPSSALITQFINWHINVPPFHKHPSLKNAYQMEMKSEMARIFKKVGKPPTDPFAMSTLASMAADVEPGRLNLWPVFEDWLKTGTNALRVASERGVKLRVRNEIVPLRVGVPLGAPRNMLPVKISPFAEHGSFYLEWCGDSAP